MNSKSAPRFADMLVRAYTLRGHEVEQWQPRAHLRRALSRGSLGKWAGYVDQYLLFPASVRRKLRQVPSDALFVFCDQAMGPWIPAVRTRAHVVHVHDLLALRSALGLVPQNPTGWSGRLYQRYIRRGFQQARHFICVSKKTRSDLEVYGQIRAATAAVVHNGMNYPFQPTPLPQAAELLSPLGLKPVRDGFLLHVGGGQWYKNLTGIVEIYARYAAAISAPLPLLCIGPPPSAPVRAAIARVPAAGEVIFRQGVDSAVLQALYSVARAFLFPSLEEGFGWPLIEAQACGCPVITTDAPPMNEVAGDAAIYLPRLEAPMSMDVWADIGAARLHTLLAENAEQRAARRERAIRWATNFDPEKTIDEYLAVYHSVLDQSRTSAAV